MKHTLRWLTLALMLAFACSQALASDHSHENINHDAPCVICDYSHDAPLSKASNLSKFLFINAGSTSFVVLPWLQTNLFFAYLTRAPPKA